MERIFFDVLENNIAVIPPAVVLLVFQGSLRKRYGAGWMKMAWLLPAFRLAIPYHFSFPFRQIPFFDAPAFFREGEGAFYAGRLLGIWVLGIALCLLYLRFTYCAFDNHCRNHFMPFKDENQEKRIRMLQKNITGRADIPVYTSAWAAGPMMTGLLRPKLVLPSAKEHWNQQELDLLLSHEMGHYRKKDLFWKAFMTAVWCLNWFNPMVFFMKRQFFYEMELACDESVLREADEDTRESYAKILLSYAGKDYRPTPFSMNFYGNKKRMQTRIDNIFDRREKKKGIGSLTAVFFLMMATSLFVSCGCSGEKPEGAEKEAQTAEEAWGTENRLPGEADPDEAEGLDGQASSETDSGELLHPTGEEVLAMREICLAGMTEEEVERLKENIKIANMTLESGYLYENHFSQYEDPEALCWNYFEQAGEIQIGWGIDERMELYHPDMGITWNEYKERWDTYVKENGTPIMTYNRFDADNFIDLMTELRDSLKADNLKQDFDNLIEKTRQAKETHDVQYLKDLYYILHDMDYYLLRYAPEDLGIYIRDWGTISAYYGALEVWKEK